MVQVCLYLFHFSFHHSLVLWCSLIKQLFLIVVIALHAALWWASKPCAMVRLLSFILDVNELDVLISRND